MLIAKVAKNLAFSTTRAKKRTGFSHLIHLLTDCNRKPMVLTLGRKKGATWKQKAPNRG
jgi:hypothetical protein